MYSREVLLSFILEKELWYLSLNATFSLLINIFKKDYVPQFSHIISMSCNNMDSVLTSFTRKLEKKLTFGPWQQQWSCIQNVQGTKKKSTSWQKICAFVYEGNKKEKVLSM